MGASLYEFRDLDLMMLIRDAANGDGLGGLSAMEVAEAIGLGEEGSRAASIRLTWMRRYGMVSFDEKSRLWRLSRGGERVTDAKLRAAASRAIDSVPEEALVDVMAHVTTRWRHGDAMTAQLLRREFLFGTARR